MVFYKNTNAYGFVYSLWFEDEYIFDLKKIELKITEDMKTTTDLITLVKENINNDWYLLSSFNEYFVPHRQSYKNRNYWHNYLLYGYDDSSEDFTIIGYTDRQLYEQTKIKYKEYIHAVTEGRESVELYFYKVKPNLKYELNIEKIRESIKNYYNCENVFEKNAYYGIDAERALINYIFENQGQLIDIRKFYALWEHKKCMINRIEYLKDNNYITGNDKYIEYISILKEIEKKARIIESLTLYYNQTFNINRLNKIISYIEQIVEMELYVYPLIYKLIH